MLHAARGRLPHRHDPPASSPATAASPGCGTILQRGRSAGFQRRLVVAAAPAGTFIRRTLWCAPLPSGRLSAADRHQRARGSKPGAGGCAGCPRPSPDWRSQCSILRSSGRRQATPDIALSAPQAATLGQSVPGFAERAMGVAKPTFRCPPVCAFRQSSADIDQRSPTAASFTQLERQPLL